MRRAMRFYFDTLAESPHSEPQQTEPIAPLIPSEEVNEQPVSTMSVDAEFQDTLQEQVSV